MGNIRLKAEITQCSTISRHFVHPNGGGQVIGDNYTPIIQLCDMDF